MLKQIGTNEYEITPLVLDEVESERLEALMKEPHEAAVRFLADAVDRARDRMTDRPLRELLA